MTKKDYIQFADAIVDAITGKDPNGETVNLNGSLLMNSLCDIFKADNPNFDRARFEDACGIVGSK